MTQKWTHIYPVNDAFQHEELPENIKDLDRVLADFILAREKELLDRIRKPLEDCCHFHNKGDRRCNCGQFKSLAIIKEQKGKG